MAYNGQYATRKTVCDPRIRGTAVCHIDAECGTCKFALKYEIETALNSIATSLNAFVDASPAQLEKLAKSLQLYGVPVCICCPPPTKDPITHQDIITLGEVACPRKGCYEEIKKNGICHCHVFKAKVPLFFEELIKRTDEQTDKMKGD